MADLPRIVIALDPFAPEASAFDVLRYLRGGEFDLAALFVEDARLLSHAQSSLAREIVGGASREIGVESLERQLRARSAELRRYFDTFAQVLRGPHAFHVARGEVVEEIERIAAHCELLVVSVARAHRGMRAHWGADVHRVVRAGAATTVFARGTATSNAFVTAVVRKVDDVAVVAPTATRVARVGRGPLRVLIAAESAEAVARVRARMAQEIAGFELPVRYDGIVDRTVETLRHAIGAESGGTLVLAASDSEADVALLGDLLAQTDWNVMLVRDASIA
jgi:hypothetical protein